MDFLIPVIFIVILVVLICSIVEINNYKSNSSFAIDLPKTYYKNSNPLFYIINTKSDEGKQMMKSLVENNSEGTSEGTNEKNNSESLVKNNEPLRGLPTFGGNPTGFRQVGNEFQPLHYHRWSLLKFIAEKTYGKSKKLLNTNTFINDLFDMISTGATGLAAINPLTPPIATNYVAYGKGKFLIDGEKVYVHK